MPPQIATTGSYPAPNFNVTEAELEARGQDAAYRLQTAMTTVVNSGEVGMASFETVIEPIAHAYNEVNSSQWFITLLRSVSPSPEVRNAASAAGKVNEEAFSSMFRSHELFLFVDKVRSDIISRVLVLDSESSRLVERIYDRFLTEGAQLAGENRDRFTAIQHEIMDLLHTFTGNLGKDPGSVWKSEDSLSGLPREKIESLEKDEEGRRRIKLTAPEIKTVMRQCSVSNTRKEIYLRRQLTFPENVTLFRNLVLLRDEGARLLGHSSYAAQMHRNYLVKTPENAEKLLSDAKERALPLRRREMAALKKLQEEDGLLHIWDIEYYQQKMLKQQRVDHELVAAYFPTDYAVPRMMELFERQLGIVIEQVGARVNENVWHSDVKMFQVWEGERSAFLGYLYTDLYPREGKTNIHANFSIQVGCLDQSGHRVPAATSLICNLSAPSADKPSLLPHYELIIVFHELGHAIHDLVGTSKFAMLNGNRTVKDFAEAPSQLLEYWCWTTEALEQLSCHYSYLSDNHRNLWLNQQDDETARQPPKTIPEELIRDLISTKNLNAGIALMQSLSRSIFDMKVYNPPTRAHLEEMDLGKVFHSLPQQLLGLQDFDDETPMGHGYATVSNFVWGAETSMYSYLQTRLYAADIWHTCFKENPMDVPTMKRYRRILLDKGGTVEELHMVTEILGRQPSSDAYFQEIGLG